MIEVFSEHIWITGELEGNDKDGILQKIHPFMVKTRHFIEATHRLCNAVQYITSIIINKTLFLSMNI